LLEGPRRVEEDALERLREREAKLMEEFERRKLALWRALRDRPIPIPIPEPPIRHFHGHYSIDPAPWYLPPVGPNPFHGQYSIDPVILQPPPPTHPDAINWPPGARGTAQKRLDSAPAAERQSSERADGRPQQRLPGSAEKNDVLDNVKKPVALPRPDVRPSVVDTPLPLPIHPLKKRVEELLEDLHNKAAKKASVLA
jgi:hypothetical protein